jgi:hypothetical protein
MPMSNITPTNLEKFNTALTFVEDRGSTGKNSLEKFVTTLPLITYYNLIYHETAIQLSQRGVHSVIEMFDGKNEFTTGIQSIKYDLDNLDGAVRKNMKKKFLKRIKRDFHSISPSREKKLDEMGISVIKGEYFFDYVTNLKDANGYRLHETIPHPNLDHDLCCYSLGCVSPDFQSKLAFERDHALADSIGGDVLQPMCKIHNRQKQDNLIFDYMSLTLLLE